MTDPYLWRNVDRRRLGGEFERRSGFDRTRARDRDIQDFAADFDRTSGSGSLRGVGEPVPYGSDRRPEGPHRGKGPRNYTRSDARILEDVNELLAEDPTLDASDIEVAVAGGEVVLEGAVESRDDKRRAEDLIELVPGVRHVQNRLRPRADPTARARGMSIAGSGSSNAGESRASPGSSAVKGD